MHRPQIHLWKNIDTESSHKSINILQLVPFTFTTQFCTVSLAKLLLMANRQMPFKNWNNLCLQFYQFFSRQCKINDPVLCLTSIETELHQRHNKHCNDSHNRCPRPHLGIIARTPDVAWFKRHLSQAIFETFSVGSFGWCGASYTGRTIRSFDARIKGYHTTLVGTKHMSFSIFKHVFNIHHEVGRRKAFIEYILSAQNVIDNACYQHQR